MDMKNAKNANYLQIDNTIRQMYASKGNIILPSREAFEKYDWTRKYFVEKPKEGYFIWIKEQTDAPLFSCVSIKTKDTRQELNNLVVIEKDLKIKIRGTCNSMEEKICGEHKAKGKIILRQNASLDYQHTHKWGNSDSVKTDYDFILEENATLEYNYKNLHTPKNLFLKTSVHSHKNSSANLNIVINAVDSKIQVEDVIHLKEKNAKGILRFRFVGRKNSETKTTSRIVAEASAEGHLDCHALLVDEDASIVLRPELENKNKDSILTHEASVGKIADEQLDYLRCRGLSEKQAIDLIVGGFLR
ncbi:MAG: SufD family Fe-S cluster assembly protein [Candidatus Aenigmarchaeota archaeon]|nr:SufD family Fe-S cluster assembly protein [Candidatus Aenigmarchaeota archaeon]